MRRYGELDDLALEVELKNSQIVCSWFDGENLEKAREIYFELLKEKHERDEK